MKLLTISRRDIHLKKIKNANRDNPINSFGEQGDGYSGFLCGMVFPAVGGRVLRLGESFQPKEDVCVVQELQGSGVLVEESGADIAISAQVGRAGNPLLFPIHSQRLRARGIRAKRY